MPSAENNAKYPHQYQHGDDVHALLAHARLQGRQWLIDLGVPEEEIRGTGARTHADLIFMAFAWKAGWTLTRKQDEPDDEGTPTEKAASLFTFGKRPGRPAGPSAAKGPTAASGAAKAKAPTKAEAKSAIEREAALVKLQRAWQRRRGRFTSRGTAIVAPRRAAIVEVRRPHPTNPTPRITKSSPSLPCAVNSPHICEPLRCEHSTTPRTNPHGPSPHALAAPPPPRHISHLFLHGGRRSTVEAPTRMPA